MNQVGRHPHEIPALSHRLADALQVSVLKIADAAVDRLEVVEGRSRPEVVPLHESDGETAKRRVPRDGSAVDAPSDDHEVELAGGERPDVPLHEGTIIRALNALLERIQRYWNERIHDLEMTRHAPGTKEFFDDLDEYRFDKLRYLPRLVDFEGYRGKTLLEVGCGIGTDLVRFAKGGAVVTGVDLSETALELARQNARHAGVSIDLEARERRGASVRGFFFRRRLRPRRSPVHRGAPAHGRRVPPGA